MAGQLSAHNFYSAVNNYFVHQWYQGIREIELLRLQDLFIEWAVG